MAAKSNGPIPQPVKRRRNADELKPIPQGERRGITVQQPQPSPQWHVIVRNYFTSMLNSGQCDWYENSDLMVLTVQCELLDRIFRGSRTELVWETEEVEYEDKDGRFQTRYVPVLDEGGNKIPLLDQYGEQERRLIGSVNGQALKAVLDMSSELLATEGARRRLRIDLGMPQDNSEPAHKAIIAKQREDLQTVLKEKKSTK